MNRHSLTALTLILLPGLLTAQLLDPKKLLEKPTDTWPTYNGDYSGRRHSTLTQINASNVHGLSLAWVNRYGSGPGIAIKSTPLMVNGDSLLHVAESCVGCRCPHRARTLALPIPGQHRQHHREPRRWDVRQLALLRNAR